MKKYFRFLVTGGAGFIGSHIAENLLKQGHFVRVLDNFFSGKEKNLGFTKGLGKDKFELLRGDVRDFNVCLKACEGIDFVTHQAALRSVPKSMSDPLGYNAVNIDGTVSMLKAALQNKIKRFVFASSSSIYGDTARFPQKEAGEEPLLISPYALTKLAGEYYCRIFSHHFNLETVCLRYFNVFGPKQALDDEYAVVVPKFIHCLINDQSPPIFGTGKQSRDFTYIDNVVEANILASQTAGIKCAIFNVANGQDYTILELVEVLNKILNKNIKPRFLDPRAGDVFKTHADISNIKLKLNYKGSIDFKEGLKRTVKYFQALPLEKR